MKPKLIITLLAPLFLSLPSLADHHKKGELKDLFNGKDLSGFTQRNGTATYEVVDGTILGTTAKGSPNSFLCTDRKYGNFELIFEVKCHNNLNSGVQIRSQTKNDDPKERVNGPQVEI
ncbi:MAG: DUF1080 domain-containing protein, partial [Verrucomicrobiota bacterium]|nr:DUF1080 domain-containing protein [Verrucomicrobiota bacterium]